MLLNNILIVNNDEQILRNIQDTLKKENFNIYPTFVTHLQNGILNYHIFAAYFEFEDVLKKLPMDVIDDIEHFIANKELIKLRLTTIEEFTVATDQALKSLGA